MAESEVWQELYLYELAEKAFVEIELVCTCSYTLVNSATIDPPDLILDPWCPVHGKDPDAEYEKHRDDAEPY